MFSILSIIAFLLIDKSLKRFTILSLLSKSLKKSLKTYRHNLTKTVLIKSPSFNGSPRTVIDFATSKLTEIKPIKLLTNLTNVLLCKFVLHGARAV